MFKKLLLPILLAATLNPITLLAQCTTDIVAPTVAISNCTGPQLLANNSTTGPFVYNWSASAPGSISSSSSATPTVSSTGPGEVIVTLIVVDGFGCTAFDQDTIMFYTPTDTFDIYTCTFPDTICPLPLGMLGSPSWTFVDSSGSSTPLTNLPGGCVEAIQMGVYQMFGIYLSACTVNHTYLVYDTCSVVGPCSVNLGADIDAISNCTGPMVTATGSGTGTLSYAWSGSTNITFSDPTLSSTMVSSTAPGTETITVTMTDGTGCVATDQMNIMYYYPTDTFYYNFLCLPDSICILPINTIGSISWTYYDASGGSSPAGNTPCIVANLQGTYELFTIYETNCTVIHKYIVSDSCGTGLYEHAQLVDADVYPNPASDVVTVITQEQITHITIWNNMGEQVMEKSNFPVGTKFSFSISNLANGSYVMRVQTKSGFVNKRVVKVK